MLSNQRHLIAQEHAHERMHRPAARQPFEPAAQRMDYNRLKRERAREGPHQPTHSIPPELIEYAYPFHHQSKANQGTISYHVLVVSPFSQRSSR